MILKIMSLQKSVGLSCTTSRCSSLRIMMETQHQLLQNLVMLQRSSKSWLLPLPVLCLQIQKWSQWQCLLSLQCQEHYGDGHSIPCTPGKLLHLLVSPGKSLCPSKATQPLGSHCSILSSYTSTYHWTCIPRVLENSCIMECLFMLSYS